MGVNHNFLYSAAYQRLREIVRSGALGPLKNLDVTYALELPQIRFGPFDAWMLRTAGNVLLEVGPHPVSVALDLMGSLDEPEVRCGKEVRIPGGTNISRQWDIGASADRTRVSINIDLSPGFSERTITPAESSERFMLT